MSDLYLLVDKASQCIENLKDAQLSNVARDLVLLDLFEISLSPMPQVFGFLDFLNFNCLLFENLLLETMLMESHITFLHLT